TSTYTLELSAELAARHIHPTFHSSLLRAHEASDDTIFPSREAQHFYDFGMPDDQEWFIEEIEKHDWVSSRSAKFWVKWTAGDYSWETPTALNDTQALDDYFEAQGVMRWQDLSK
ncbi:hypothetical protein C8R44DRAFT_583676, partial [Mycena epipterygia]